MWSPASNQSSPTLVARRVLWRRRIRGGSRRDRLARRRLKFRLQPRGIARLVLLLHARDRERIFRDVARHGRARGYIRVLSDLHRRHELRVAADERKIPDRRLVLLEAVVV